MTKERSLLWGQKKLYSHSFLAVNIGISERGLKKTKRRPLMTRKQISIIIINNEKKLNSHHHTTTVASMKLSNPYICKCYLGRGDIKPIHIESGAIKHILSQIKIFSSIKLCHVIIKTSEIQLRYRWTFIWGILKTIL